MSDVPALRVVVEVGRSVAGVLDELTPVPLKPVLLEVFGCGPVGVTRVPEGDEVECEEDEVEEDEVELPPSEGVDVWMVENGLEEPRV